MCAQHNAFIMLLLIKQYHDTFRSKTPRFKEIKSFLEDAK